MNALFAILALSAFGLVLVIVLFKTNRPLLELVLSLQKRVAQLESHPSFYSQTVDGLNRRVDYLQKKLDERQYELRVVQGDRASLLATVKILEEQNKMLSDSLRVLRS
jgi:uncharacterized coiled-coil protein SlyX